MNKEETWRARVDAIVLSVYGCDNQQGGGVINLNSHRRKRKMKNKTSSSLDTPPPSRTYGCDSAEVIQLHPRIKGDVCK